MTCFIPFHPHIKRGRGAVAVGSDRDPRTGTSAVRLAITGGTCMEQMSPASPTAGKAGEQKQRPDMSLTDPDTQLPHSRPTIWQHEWLHNTPLDIYN